MKRFRFFYCFLQVLISLQMHKQIHSRLQATWYRHIGPASALEVVGTSKLGGLQTTLPLMQMVTLF